MNATEQARFRPFYAAMRRALELQGKAEKTVEAYARGIRRTAEFFDRCPDDLTAEDLRTYFAELLESRSWSTVKLDRCGLQLFYRYVPNKPWEWTDILKPPRATRLPDVLTREKTLRLLATVRKRFSTHMLELGVDLRELHSVLGHAHPEPTARYTHPTRRHQRAQARERQGKLLESFVLRWRDAA